MKQIIVLISIVLLAGCGNMSEHKNRDGEETPDNEAQYPEREGIAVELETLKLQQFQHFIEINGSVRAEKEVIISPETSGTIMRIHVEEGQKVKKGELIVSLNSSIIRSNIRELETSLELANANYEKQAALWEQNIGTEMQYLQAKNNKESLERKLQTLNAQLEMTKIRSPFQGIIDQIFIKEGELATPGIRILHIVNLSHLKVYGAVSESLLPNIMEGDLVSLGFPVYPNYLQQASIHRKGEVINEKSRTFKIEIKLKNGDNKLKPNMISKIRLNDFTAENALVVPSNIIKHDFNGSFLYVAEKNGDHLVAKKTYVKPGISYESKTLILEGLNKDEQIIVVGYNMVSSGAHIYDAS